MAEARVVAKDKSWSGILSVMAMANILCFGIVSVYPSVNITTRPVYHQRISPVEPMDVPDLCLFWCRDGDFDHRPGAVFQPNHVVPLLNVEKVHQKRTHPSSSTVPRKQSKIASFFQRKLPAPKSTLLGNNLIGYTIMLSNEAVSCIRGV